MIFCQTRFDPKTRSGWLKLKKKVTHAQHSHTTQHSRIHTSHTHSHGHTNLSHSKLKSQNTRVLISRLSQVLTPLLQFSSLNSLSSLNSQESRRQKHNNDTHTRLDTCTHCRRNSRKWLWHHQMQQTHSVHNHHRQRQPDLLLPPTDLLLPPTDLLLRASISPSSSKHHLDSKSSNPNPNFPFEICSFQFNDIYIVD